MTIFDSYVSDYSEENLSDLQSRANSIEQEAAQTNHATPLLHDIRVLSIVIRSLWLQNSRLKYELAIARDIHTLMEGK